MRLLAISAALIVIHSLAVSATIYVPDDYSTIQEAIDASSNGETIIVRPGTYVENIDFKGKAISVRSEQGAAVTTIDGSQAESVVMFRSREGPDSILAGFTLANHAIQTLPIIMIGTGSALITGVNIWRASTDN